MAIKAVIFDLDGTLAEFNLDFKAVRAEVKQFLINQGFPASVFHINESIFEMLKKAKVYMTNNGKTEHAFLDIQEHVLSIAMKHELKAAHQTSLLPGVFETLKMLKKMKLKLAIFTINGEKSTNLILDNFRLRQFFDAITTRDAVSKVKPDPLHLATALKELDLNADDVIVVGDSIVDMKSARALNVVAVGMARGDQLIRNLKRAGAAYTVESITELPNLLMKLGENAPQERLSTDG